MSFDIASLVSKSQGIKRTLASILAAAATIAGYVPALAPYQAPLAAIAGILGGLGVVHAAASK